MRHRTLVLGCLAVGGLGFAGCSDGPTQPGSSLDPPDSHPQLAVTSNSWIAWPSTRQARYGMAAGKIDQIVYVAGGWTLNFFARSRVDAFDLATKTWRQVRSMPSGRSELNGATPIDRKLYVTGGISSGDPATKPQRSRKNLFVYDVATDTWSRKADMPAASCGSRGAQGAIDGQLYVYVPCPAGAGGVEALYGYDPATNVWRTLTGPPHGHSFGAGGVINGKFYLVSGSGQSGLSRELDVYDPVTDTWSSGSPLPADLREFVAGAIVRGKLYVVGGVEGSAQTIVGTLEEYDPATDEWTRRPPMPTPRFRSAAAVAGGKLMVIGGFDGRNVRTTVEAYVP